MIVRKRKKGGRGENDRGRERGREGRRETDTEIDRQREYYTDHSDWTVDGLK